MENGFETRTKKFGVLVLRNLSPPVHRNPSLYVKESLETNDVTGKNTKIDRKGLNFI